MQTVILQQIIILFFLIEKGEKKTETKVNYDTHSTAPVFFLYSILLSLYKTFQEEKKYKSNIFLILLKIISLCRIQMMIKNKKKIDH
jgi:hypothetical protein